MQKKNSIYMKYFGWFFIIMGSLSLLGAILKGHNPTGPFFWLGLGIYLVHRASEKKKEQKEKDKWANKSNPSQDE